MIEDLGGLEMAKQFIPFLRHPCMYVYHVKVFFFWTLKVIKRSIWGNFNCAKQAFIEAVGDVLNFLDQ